MFLRTEVFEKLETESSESYQKTGQSSTSKKRPDDFRLKLNEQLLVFTALCKTTFV